MFTKYLMVILLNNNSYVYIFTILLFSCHADKIEVFGSFEKNVQENVIRRSFIKSDSDIIGRSSLIWPSENLISKDVSLVLVELDSMVNKDYNKTLEQIKKNHLHKFMVGDELLTQNLVSGNDILNFIQSEDFVIPIPSLAKKSQLHQSLDNYYNFAIPEVYITDYEYGYFFKRRDYKKLDKFMSFYKEHGFTNGAIVDEKLGLIVFFIIVW